VDEAERVLKPLVTIGLPTSYIESCGNIPIGEQCCGRAVAHRKPWIVTAMLTDPLFASAREAAIRSPIRSVFSVPAMSEDGRCVGSLACHYSEIHTPSAGDIERNTTWASMIAHTLCMYWNSAIASDNGSARNRAAERDGTGSTKATLDIPAEASE
jgi:hypothetical protein